MCVYVCVYVCICMCICMYVYMYVCVYIYIYIVSCQIVVRIWLKIGRYDIQVRESNLVYVHLLTPHCSSGVTKRSSKMALCLPQFYFYQREFFGFHMPSLQRGVNAF